MIERLRELRPLAVLILALAASASGCGSDPEPPRVEPAAPETGVAGVPRVEPPALDSPLVDRGGFQLPESFPEDVEPYADADLLGVTEEDGKVFVQMSTGDGIDTVADYYEAKFATDGWSTRRVYDPEDASLGGAVFAEKGGRSATVFITSTDRGALVDIFVEPEVH